MRMSWLRRLCMMCLSFCFYPEIHSDIFTGGFPAIEINQRKPRKKEMRVLSAKSRRASFPTCWMMDTCKFGVLLTCSRVFVLEALCAAMGQYILKEQTIRIDATLRGCAIPVPLTVHGQGVIGTQKRYFHQDDSHNRLHGELCGKMNPQFTAYFCRTNYMERVRCNTGEYTRECGGGRSFSHTSSHVCDEPSRLGLRSSRFQVLGRDPTITLDRYVHSSLILKQDNEKIERRRVLKYAVKLLCHAHEKHRYSSVLPPWMG